MSQTETTQQKQVERVKCPQCGKELSPKSLPSHVSRVHRNKAESPNQSKPEKLVIAPTSRPKHKRENVKSEEKTEDGGKWRIVLYLAIIAGVGFLVWYLFLRKRGENVDNQRFRTGY